MAARPPRRPARRRRAAAGHTLIELVVVATIASILMTLTLRASRPMTASALDQRDRAAASSELRMAVEALLADLGGAERVQAEGRDRLRILREEPVARLRGGWNKNRDEGIVYSLQDGLLLRDDMAGRTRVAMARGISRLQVDDKRGLGTTITIDSGKGESLATLTLVWPG